jgi:hypothetical protein
MRHRGGTKYSRFFDPVKINAKNLRSLRRKYRTKKRQNCNRWDKLTDWKRYDNCKKEQFHSILNQHYMPMHVEIEDNPIHAIDDSRDEDISEVRYEVFGQDFGICKSINGNHNYKIYKRFCQSTLNSLHSIRSLRRHKNDPNNVIIYGTDELVQHFLSDLSKNRKICATGMSMGGAQLAYAAKRIMTDKTVPREIKDKFIKNVKIITITSVYVPTDLDPKVQIKHLIKIGDFSNRTNGLKEHQKIIIEKQAKDENNEEFFKDDIYPNVFWLKNKVAEQHKITKFYDHLADILDLGTIEEWKIHNSYGGYLNYLREEDEDYHKGIENFNYFFKLLK